MARDLRRRDAGFHIPGAYVTFVRKQAERAVQPDPRMLLTDQAGRYYQMKFAAETGVERVFTELMAVGGPIVVPAWHLGGHSVPLPAHLRPMFRGSEKAADAFTVFADDRVVAA